MRTLRTLFLIAASSCALLLAATAQIPESCPRVVDQPGWSSATYGITQDIGLVINQMFVTQGSPGKAACVSLYGLPSPPANHSLGDYEGVYWANTSPWLGLGNTAVTKIDWPPNVVIATSVPWDTPSQQTYIMGTNQSNNSPTSNSPGSTLLLCPLFSCGPNAYPQFPVTNYAQGPPLALAVLSTVTAATFTGGSTSATLTTLGSSVTTAKLTNAVIVVQTNSGGCSTSHPCYTDHIATASGSTGTGPFLVTFSAAWETSGPTNCANGCNLYAANATAVLRIGYQGGGWTTNGFGSRFQDVRLDCEGYGSCVGGYNENLQEGTVIDGMSVSMDQNILQTVAGNSRQNQGVGLACWAFDKTFVGKQGTQNAGPVHYYFKNGRCDLGQGAGFGVGQTCGYSSGIPSCGVLPPNSPVSFGYIFESYSIALGKTGGFANSAVELGTVEGMGGVLWYGHSWIDGGTGFESAKSHGEHIMVWHDIGEVNATAGIVLHSPSSAFEESTSVTPTLVRIGANTVGPVDVENANVSTGYSSITPIVDLTSGGGNTLLVANNQRVGYYRIDAAGAVQTDANPGCGGISCTDIKNGIATYNGTRYTIQSGNTTSMLNPNGMATFVGSMSAGSATLGVASTTTGTETFDNSASAFGTTVSPGSPSAAVTMTLPTTTGTFMDTAGTNTMASGSIIDTNTNASQLYDGPSPTTSVSDFLCDVSSGVIGLYTCASSIGTTETFFTNKLTIPGAGSASKIDGIHGGLRVDYAFDVDTGTGTVPTVALRLYACSSSTCTTKTELWGTGATTTTASQVRNSSVTCTINATGTANQVVTGCVNNLGSPTNNLSPVQSSVPNSSANWVLAWSVVYGTATENAAVAQNLLAFHYMH